MLHDYGYTSFCIGKSHNTPSEETGISGPYDRWPTGPEADLHSCHGQSARSGARVATDPEAGNRLGIRLVHEAEGLVQRSSWRIVAPGRDDRLGRERHHLPHQRGAQAFPVMGGVDHETVEVDDVILDHVSHRAGDLVILIDADQPLQASRKPSAAGM